MIFRRFANWFFCILFSFSLDVKLIHCSHETIIWILPRWSHHWWVRQKLKPWIIVDWFCCCGLSTIARWFSIRHGMISNIISRLISISVAHDIEKVKEIDQGRQANENANTNRKNLIRFHFMNNSALIGWNSTRFKKYF